MLKLTYYFALRTLKMFLLAVFLLGSIFAVFDFMETSAYSNIGFLKTLYLYPLKFISSMGFIIPAASLFAVLVSFSDAGQKGELIAVSSVGLTPAIPLFAILLIPAISVFLSMVFVNSLGPLSYRKWSELIDANKKDTTISSQLPQMWSKDGNTIILKDSNNEIKIAIFRNNSGTPESLIINNGIRLIWEKAKEWKKLSKPDYLKLTKTIKSGSVKNFNPNTGEITHSSSELKTISTKLAGSGIDSVHFTARAALLDSLIFSSFFLPFFGLGIALVLRTYSTFYLMLTGLGVTLLCWIILSTLWNLAALKILHPNWVRYGTPLFFVLAGTFLFIAFFSRNSNRLHIFRSFRSLRS